MTKEKHPLLAVAAASLAVALAACDQTTPAAGGPGPGAAPGAPAAEPGLRTETLIVAIVADEDEDAGLARRVATTQTNVTEATTLHFPSDFGAPVLHDDSFFTAEYDFNHHLPVAGITQSVLDRGGIIPWASVNGGRSWHAGGFDLGGAVKLRFEYRAGDAEDEDASGSVTITLAAIGIVRSGGGHDFSSAAATRTLQRYLKDNRLLIRFFIITDQE